jgi:ribosomal protein S20
LKVKWGKKSNKKSTIRTITRKTKEKVKERSKDAQPIITKENPTLKNQGQKPIYQKYKANKSTSKHNPKKK